MRFLPVELLRMNPSSTTLSHFPHVHLLLARLFPACPFQRRSYVPFSFSSRLPLSRLILSATALSCMRDFRSRVLGFRVSDQSHVFSGCKFHPWYACVAECMHARVHLFVCTRLILLTRAVYKLAVSDNPSQKRQNREPGGAAVAPQAFSSAPAFAFAALLSSSDLPRSASLLGSFPCCRKSHCRKSYAPLRLRKTPHLPLHLPHPACHRHAYLSTADMRDRGEGQCCTFVPVSL